MPLITTTITPFTHTPSRQNPATFSEDMDYRLSEENSRIAQMNNLGTQMNSVADLVNTIETNLNLVANDLTNIDTVATNITKVNTVSTNITKVSNLDTNMTKITNLDTNMTKIANVDNNMSKLSNLDTNMTKIANVDTNINDIISVADNEANINTVAENIGSITSKIGTADIHNSASKTTPADNDELAILDSASSWSLKKLTWGNLKDTLKTYLNTLYIALSGNQTITGVKSFSDNLLVGTATDNGVDKLQVNGRISSNNAIVFGNKITNIWNGYSFSTYIGARFFGIINVSSVYSDNASIRTSASYLVNFLDDDHTTIQLLGSVINIGGGCTFNIGFSNGNFTVVNSSGRDNVSIYVTFNGSTHG